MTRPIHKLPSTKPVKRDKSSGKVTKGRLIPSFILLYDNISFFINEQVEFKICKMNPS